VARDYFSQLKAESPTRVWVNNPTVDEIGLAIETLAGLRDKGFLTDEEFSEKKAELLGRL